MAGRGTELKFLVFGRPFKPLSLAVMLATSILIPVNIYNVGLLGTSDWGDLLGVFAAINVAGFLYSWWRGNQALAETSLLFASGIWTSRAMLGLMADGWQWSNYGTALSACWSIAAGGAYLLERAETHAHRRGK